MPIGLLGKRVHRCVSEWVPTSAETEEAYKYRRFGQIFRLVISKQIRENVCEDSGDIRSPGCWSFVRSFVRKLETS